MSKVNEHKEVEQDYGEYPWHYSVHQQSTQKEEDVRVGKVMQVTLEVSRYLYTYIVRYLRRIITKSILIRNRLLQNWYQSGISNKISSF